MAQACPYCSTHSPGSESSDKVVRAGFYRRTSDSKKVQRFRCEVCLKYFSTATFHPCYRQKKRGFNFKIARELSSGVSQRRIARSFHLSRSTVKRKFLFMARQAQEKLQTLNLQCMKANIIEFDDLETFEHTKCKPLSITLAVEHSSRRILGFEVAKMPAKGKIAKLARKKYGPRLDERSQKRRLLFERIKPLIADDAVIKSDENPHYIKDVMNYFPGSFHERHKGQRGSIVGQGELKKVRFDPLFSLNHTCAMLRANVNRLFRRTWCTTKIAENLSHHIAIYALFHNKVLINSS